MVERVLVSGITDAKNQCTHIQRYLSSLTSATECTVVKMYGDHAVATFVSPIGTPLCNVTFAVSSWYIVVSCC